MSFYVYDSFFSFEVSFPLVERRRLCHAKLSAFAFSNSLFFISTLHISSLRTALSIPFCNEMEFLSDFRACVTHHVTKWQKAIFSLADVEDLVAYEKRRNDELRHEVDSLKAEIREREETMAARLAKQHDQLKEVQAAYAEQAREPLALFDDLSMASHFYSQLLSTAKSHEFACQQLLSRELQEYGYQSKKLIAAGLTFDALKMKVGAGKPFRKELSALLESMENEGIVAVARPTLAVADTGVADHLRIRAAAQAFSQSIEDAVSFQPDDALKSWLDLAKFRNVISPSAKAQQVSDQERAARYSRRFLRAVEGGHLNQALDQSSEVVAAFGVRDTPNAQALRRAQEAFVALAQPAVATEQFVQFVADSLTETRFAFVEQVLKL
jgi:hypothetical protein